MSFYFIPYVDTIVYIIAITIDREKPVAGLSVLSIFCLKTKTKFVIIST